MRFRHALLITLVGFSLVGSALSQARSTLRRGCPNSFAEALVQIQADGDLAFTPCPTRSWEVDRTITAGGTTGNQTINKTAGTVNFAAGTGTTGITVTNSLAAVNSLIFVIARTNDTTCSVKNVVSAGGSFVIRMDANCTAETSVGFWLIN